MDQALVTDIQQRIKECGKCKCRQTVLKKVEENPEYGEKYFSLVGDPCYKFNRLSKERFLNDQNCAFLILKAQNYLREKIVENKSYEPELSVRVLEELLEMARRTVQTYGN